MYSQLLIGILLGVIAAVLAYRMGALSLSGLLAAVAVGGLIFGFGGIEWAVLLLTFFVSSSLLSRTFVGRKIFLTEKFSKGSRRDWGQVIANGGLGAFLAVVYGVISIEYQDMSSNTAENLKLFWVAYAGSLAAVTADTWATELGVLSGSPPRMISSGKRVERGSSGGVSLLGSLAALLGAFVIGIAAVLLMLDSVLNSTVNWVLILSVMLGGFFGSLFDSFLGATWQAIYYCPNCRKDTERHPHHSCGTATVQIRGLSWLNNDLVNFFASAIGMIVSVAIWIAIV